MVPDSPMDFSDAERVEIRAYQERYLALEKLWERNGCNSDVPNPEAESTAQARASLEEVNDRLRTLNELKEEGLISDEEYTQKRQEVIKEL